MPGTPEDIRKLCHDLANPLGALFAEVQLLLIEPDSFDPETLRALRQIESLARRMRDILAAGREPA